MSGAVKRKLKKQQFAFLCEVLAGDWIKDFSLAIDGGANVGSWAIRMADSFDRVIAFEPAPEIFFDLRQATRLTINIECRQQALLDRATKVQIVKPSAGKSLRSLYVQPKDDGTVDAVTIDSLDLPSCGFIKLDLEGAEYPALRGAERTIASFRPVLMAEMDQYGFRFGYSLEQTEALFASMGYAEVGRCRPDRVYLPAERLS